MTEEVNKQDAFKTSPLNKTLRMTILVASYSFLVYKLITFDQYPELAEQWSRTGWNEMIWLAGVFLLLPFNWLMEAFKWKKLTSSIESLSLSTSLKSVLAGITSGFMTPNRIGELVGRILYLKPENRKPGVTLSFVNSLTQNIVMAVSGIPACLIFFSEHSQKTDSEIRIFLISVMIGLVLLAFVYFALPFFSRRISGRGMSSKFAEFTHCLTSHSLKDLLEVIMISEIRYLIFCTQFYMMLHFFGVRLDLWQALLTIPTSYLFVTFTPSFAFSEVAVRSSFAVLFIGAFSTQVVGIALASVALWIVNFAIPMVIGSILLMRQPWSEINKSY